MSALADAAAVSVVFVLASWVNLGSGTCNLGSLQGIRLSCNQNSYITGTSFCLHKGSGKTVLETSSSGGTWVAARPWLRELFSPLPLARRALQLSRTLCGERTSHLVCSLSWLCSRQQEANQQNVLLSISPVVSPQKPAHLMAGQAQPPPWRCRETAARRC